MRLATEEEIRVSTIRSENISDFPEDLIALVEKHIKNVSFKGVVMTEVLNDIGLNKMVEPKIEVFPFVNGMWLEEIDYTGERYTHTPVVVYSGGSSRGHKSDDDRPYIRSRDGDSHYRIAVGRFTYRGDQNLVKVSFHTTGIEKLGYEYDTIREEGLIGRPRLIEDMVNDFKKQAEEQGYFPTSAYNNKREGVIERNGRPGGNTIQQAQLMRENWVFYPINVSEGDEHINVVEFGLDKWNGWKEQVPKDVLDHFLDFANNTMRKFAGPLYLGIDTSKEGHNMGRRYFQHVGSV